jgi:hypothetical protein
MSTPARQPALPRAMGTRRQTTPTPARITASTKVTIAPAPRSRRDAESTMVPHFSAVRYGQQEPQQ